MKETFEFLFQFTAIMITVQIQNKTTDNANANASLSLEVFNLLNPTSSLSEYKLRTNEIKFNGRKTRNLIANVSCGSGVRAREYLSKRTTMNDEINKEKPIEAEKNVLVILLFSVIVAFNRVKFLN